MRDKFRVAENKENKVRIICLTSNDITADNLIAMEQTPKPERTKQQVGYPLRFRSKAQKKRLEEAAKKQHKTLKDFLIDLGEKAAAELQEVAS